MAISHGRILDLLNLLQGARYHSARDLARRLEVSTRTLRRDIEQLRSLGYPVRGDRGVAGGYELEPGAALPPLSLSSDEAVAVVVGLRTASESGVAGIRDAALGALSKIMRVLPARERATAKALHAALPKRLATEHNVLAGPEILAALAAAQADRRVLSVRYRTHRGDESTREIEPRDLVFRNHTWYSVAYDCTCNEWRTMRVDRMSEPETLKREARPRSAPYTDAERYVEQAIIDTIGRYDVIVEVHAPAAEVRQFFGGWAHVTPVMHHVSRVSIRAGSIDWVVGELVAMDRTFTVTSPPELQFAVLARAQRLAASAQLQWG